MKCPNCGKEAIFVNGKYVCLDCGIEISPEQQAAQNMTESQVFASDLPVAAVAEPIAAQEPETASPVTEDLPTETPVSVEETTPKPVQEYYEETLKQDDPSTTNNSGVYDFSSTEAQVNAVPTEPAPEAVVEPTIASLSPTESEPATSEPATAAAPDTYFAPSSFDINQTNQNPVSPEPFSPAPTDFEAPANLGTVDLGQEVANTFSEPAAEPATAPVSTPMTEASAFPEPLTTAKTLDEMLGASSPAAPIDDSPISAYGPTSPMPEPSPANIQDEGAMPSVESVFGATTEPQGASDPKLPTAQDFGVAPKPKKQKNTKWILPVSIAAGALLLLVSISLVLIAISNKKSEVTYPVVMTDEGINTLSAAVSTAMQVGGGAAADYSFEADFSDLKVLEGVTDKTTFETQLQEPYKLTGSWYTDKDGDITIETAIGERTDKRTYIKSTSETFVYSPETQKYTKQTGQILSGVPVIYGAEEKTALLYTTNIKAASLVAKEQIDGAEYSKYEITPNEDIVKDTLSGIGGVFKDAIYQQVVTDNFKINVWVGSDNKIKKITTAGEIEIETDKVKGAVKLTGEALYQYIDISIESPTASAGAIKDTGAPVSAAKSNEEEEGQTSSINSDEGNVIEARG